MTHRVCTPRSNLLREIPWAMEMHRMEFVPGAKFGGNPHRSGTRECLSGESGKIEVTASGETFTLDAGDVLVFRGDQKHSYANAARGSSLGILLILIG